jgi:hypothetical protein
MDDIEILPPADFKTLSIQGTSSIQIPTSGEHREQYSAHLDSPNEKTSQTVDAIWSLREPHDALISIEKEGSLIIPSGVQDKSVTITANYPAMESTITDEFKVELTGGSQTTSEKVSTQAATANPNQPAISAYDQFSKGFETWAVENRPLFVALSIGVILVIILLLSILQNRIK